ncbi:MAG: hypothetical protein ABFD81_14515 [Syntrophaceae bacterium]
MVVGEKTREKIVELIQAQLEEYSGAIDAAYLRMEKTLSISIGVKLSENPKNSLFVDVDTTVSFKIDEIKDKAHGTVSEVQISVISEMEKGSQKTKASDQCFMCKLPAGECPHGQQLSAECEGCDQYMSWAHNQEPERVKVNAGKGSQAGLQG